MALIRKTTQTEITTVIVEDTPKTTTETEAPVEQSYTSAVSAAEHRASSSVHSSTPSSASKSQAKKPVAEQQAQKGFYVPVSTKNDLKADRELNTVVKAATVGILAVLSTSMIMLLMYLNREYISSTGPGAPIVGRHANVTVIVVPETVQHRTWPTRRDSDLPPRIPIGPGPDIEPDTITPYTEEPYSDYPDTLPPEKPSWLTGSKSEAMTTEEAISTLSTEPAANMSDHNVTELEAMTIKEVISSMSTEPAASTSQPDVTESEEMYSTEVPVTSSEEPPVNESEPGVIHLEEMTSKEVIVTPPKEPALNALEHGVTQSERMTSKEIIVTPSEELVVGASRHPLGSMSDEMNSEEVIVTALVSPEIRGRLRHDRMSDGKEPPMKTAKTAVVNVSEQRAFNPPSLFLQSALPANDDKADPARMSL
ncbi:uncharacterized protein LOC142768865 [Rhipicephalus microplus]|uniref:uncharacterized protein LOC142768865 n=1 Tax=Rhipicephalus microplus TaxID=6941 RepID=UPI003F6AE2F1